jgi:hypothetical protein
MDIKDSIIEIPYHSNFQSINFGRIIANAQHLDVSGESSFFYLKENVWKNEDLDFIVKQGWVSFRKDTFGEKNNLFLGKISSESKKNIIAIGQRYFSINPESNKEFNHFLARIFTDSEDCLFPYDIKDREDKLEALFKKIN